MLHFRWLPWRFVVSRLARSHGFIDPIALLSRLHRFAQPSEVTEPIELLRAGVVFHARGLINARSIQHNLEWVWPYWIERQFNPRDRAFVPRAFSLTHINLTLRNWTAVGLPGVDWFPIVDPRGLVTPFADSWSLDFWLLPEGEPALLPSREPEALQRLNLTPGPQVETQVGSAGARLTSRVEMVRQGGQPTLRVALAARSSRPARLVIAVRPANPEGVSFIETLELDPQGEWLSVNGTPSVKLESPPSAARFSDYHQGDVRAALDDPEAAPGDRGTRCEVGLATGALIYPLEAGHTTELRLTLPMAAHPVGAPPAPQENDDGPWEGALEGACRLQIPDQRMQRLFDQALVNLRLHAPGDLYPGPYTYHRFWFRDAALMLNALLTMGLEGPAARALGRFPERQTALGYFHSQEGEWDANGEVLWVFDRFRRLTGRPLPEAWYKAVVKGAHWIQRKRLADDGSPHGGLLPAGFSAEHLGPNDYYYWDDLWSVGGLQAAAACAEAAGDTAQSQRFAEEAQSLMAAVEQSLERSRPQRRHPGIPASPYRDMDSGAIGSLAGGYPLQLWPADHPDLLAGCEFMLENCSVHGGFFQDMIHSGINAYLTLHLAQVLLRAGDPRQQELVAAVAGLASDTGQWPEAIHPHTGGGCMGDGQHLWAAAEWLLMLRHWFLREEGAGLVLASGLPPAWLRGETPMELGPTPTPFGPVTVTVEPGPQGVTVRWQGQWRGPAPAITVAPTGYRPQQHAGDTCCATFNHAGEAPA